MSEHDKHCFVAMPNGRSDEDQKNLGARYSEVLAPAIRKAGYEPKLATATDAPSKITDDIRTHLALDGMAVFDVGGLRAGDEANANVLYEVGIRHAFDLPAVICAWSKAQIPFDVEEQRFIIEPKDFAAIGRWREKLASYIAAAAAGNFYRPMEAIRSAQRITAADTTADQFRLDVAAAFNSVNAKLAALQSSVDVVRAVHEQMAVDSIRNVHDVWHATPPWGDPIAGVSRSPNSLATLLDLAANLGKTIEANKAAAPKVPPTNKEP